MRDVHHEHLVAAGAVRPPRMSGAAADRGPHGDMCWDSAQNSGRGGMKRTRFPCTLRLREDSPEPRAPPPRAEPPRLRPVFCSCPRSSLFSPSGVALMALRFRGAESGSESSPASRAGCRVKTQAGGSHGRAQRCCGKEVCLNPVTCS